MKRNLCNFFYQWSEQRLFCFPPLAKVSHVKSKTKSLFCCFAISANLFTRYPFIVIQSQTGFIRLLRPIWVAWMIYRSFKYLAKSSECQKNNQAGFQMWSFLNNWNAYMWYMFAVHRAAMSTGRMTSLHQRLQINSSIPDPWRYLSDRTILGKCLMPLSINMMEVQFVSGCVYDWPLCSKAVITWCSSKPFDRPVGRILRPSPYSHPAHVPRRSSLAGLHHRPHGDQGYGAEAWLLVDGRLAWLSDPDRVRVGSCRLARIVRLPRVGRGRRDDEGDVDLLYSRSGMSWVWQRHRLLRPERHPFGKHQKNNINTSIIHWTKHLIGQQRHGKSHFDYK